MSQPGQTTKFQLGDTVWIAWGLNTGARGNVVGIREIEGEFPRYELDSTWSGLKAWSEPLLASNTYKMCEDCGNVDTYCDVLVFPECPHRRRRHRKPIQVFTSPVVCDCGRLCESEICCKPKA